jgi:hypothetical protein
MTENCRTFRLFLLYNAAVNGTKKGAGMVVDGVEFENGWYVAGLWARVWGIMDQKACS